MIASFILSRTLVPTMAAYLLRARLRRARTGREPKGRFGRFQAGFERGFDRFRERYRELLGTVVARRGAIHCADLWRQPSRRWSC